MKKLIKAICENEGKKVEVSRGNVLEIMKVLKTLINNDPDLRREFKAYLKK